MADMDDGGYSNSKANGIISSDNDIDSTLTFAKRNAGLYEQGDLYPSGIFQKRFRFGMFDMNGPLFTTREFLFFTKPDLHIIQMDDDTGTCGSDLNSDLSSDPYFVQMYEQYKPVIAELQGSYDYTPIGGSADPFNNLLGNSVISNLTVPSLEAETIETSSNIYGVNLTYRGSSEASNDSFDFDLEFRDSRWLYVYHFFKMYEEYETLKHHGTVSPYRGYITNKVLHDQFSIYKILVAEDMETIVYWAKFWGVIPKSLPRDVFSAETFESGLSYTISFKAAFFDDMKVPILDDFNTLYDTAYADTSGAGKYRIDVYNDYIGKTDNRPARSAYVVKEQNLNVPTGYVYKLKWKGSDQY